MSLLPPLCRPHNRARGRRPRRRPRVGHTHCSHDVVDGIAYCPECGVPMCPICGCHDVAQVSRITGYLGDVARWNAAKRQELKDRVCVEVGL